MFIWFWNENMKEAGVALPKSAKTAALSTLPEMKKDGCFRRLALPW